MDVKKTISSLVAAAVIGGTGVIQTTKPLEPIDTIAVNEIVSQRTATAKVFDVGGGQRKAVIGTAARHWKDDDGKWKVIDTSVRKRALLTSVLSKYEYATVSGTYKAYFDEESDSDYGYIANDSQIDFVFLDTDSTVTVETETTDAGVKQTYVLSDKTAPDILRWKITSDADLVNSGDANADYIYEKNDKYAFTVAKPAAWDKNNNTVKV